MPSRDSITKNVLEAIERQAIIWHERDYHGWRSDGTEYQPEEMFSNPHHVALGICTALGLRGEPVRNIISDIIYRQRWPEGQHELAYLNTAREIVYTFHGTDGWHLMPPMPEHDVE